MNLEAMEAMTAETAGVNTSAGGGMRVYEGDAPGGVDDDDERADMQGQAGLTSGSFG